MDIKIKNQILVIRQTGLTNMFDIGRVLEISKVMEFDELEEYIPEHKAEYVNFILIGE